MRTLLLFLLFSATLSAELERVHAHFLIGDDRAAYEEAAALLRREPASLPVLEAAVRASARSGREREAKRLWERYRQLAKSPYENRALLEEIAWGVIGEGFRSSLPIVRLTASVGAFYGQDAQGVALLERALEDPNCVVRSVALQLCSNLRDTKLKNKVLQLFRQERAAAVRLQAVHAVGGMKIEEARPELFALLDDPAAPAEMKGAAIEAIVSMQEGVEPEELALLVRSRRAGLRQLACRAVRFFECKEAAPLLLPLLEDAHPDVRRRAVAALGSLRLSEIGGREAAALFEEKLGDSNPSAAIAAAWALTFWDEGRAEEAWNRFLNHRTQRVRIEAAAALAAAGKYGVRMAKRAFYAARDPYVRLNLAYGLLMQREEPGAVCEALYRCPKQVRERMMWESEGEFRALAPSRLQHDALIPNHPEAVDQMTRLELLNALAILGDPRALDAVKSFLQERRWGIAGAASALLLSEGDEAAVELVQALLDDRDPKVRIQAALILSFWGEGDSAVAVLREAYPSADREMKARILEGVGNCRSEEAIPFLADKLDESYPTLRIIAAAALLHRLYL